MPTEHKASPDPNVGPLSPFALNPLPLSEEALGLKTSAVALLATADPTAFSSFFPLNLHHPQQEYAVMHFTTVWDDLIGLLANPRQFVRDVQTNWGIQAGDPGWEFGKDDDIAVILQPGQIQPTALSLVQSIFATRVRALDSELWGNILQIDPTNLLGAITKTMTENGAWLAEFAVNTRMLIVSYWKPGARTAYAGDLTEASIALHMAMEQNFSGTPVAGRFGTLHFDVGSPGQIPSDEDRARFVKACIESRGFIDAKLRGKTLYGDAVMTDTRPVSITPPGTPFMYGFLDPDVDPDHAYPGPRIVIDRVPQKVKDESSERSEESVAEATPTPVCFTCCNINCIQDANGNMMMGDMLLKEYCGP